MADHPQAIVLLLEDAQGAVGEGSCRFRVEREAIIGRGADADLTLADVRVSRRHARVFAEQDAWWVEDAGSTSGCWLNSTRVAGRRRVMPGDELRLGGVVLRVSKEPEAP